jgi:hypothetical protein
MYPEGVPTSASGQAILYYQTLTRQMMYKCVWNKREGRQLVAAGSDVPSTPPLLPHPTPPHPSSPCVHYRRIAAAIKEAGLEASGVVPTDYLQFFCLGKREASPDGATACPEAAVEEASATPGAPEREQQMTAEAVTAQVCSSRSCGAIHPKHAVGYVWGVCMCVGFDGHQKMASYASR